MKFDYFLSMLEKVSNDYATHYALRGRVYASVYNNVADLVFKAHLDKADMASPFSFTYTGPIAIIQLSPVMLSKEMPLDTSLCIVAIMSTVTFADVSLFDELSPKIIPSQVGPYAAGDPELFDIAKRLICHHTGSQWDEGFLSKLYKAEVKAFIQTDSKLTSQSN